MTETTTQETGVVCDANGVIPADVIGTLQEVTYISQAHAEGVLRDVLASHERLRQMQADGERYRFLRDNPLGLRAVDGNAKYPPPSAEQMDRYVDQARETAAEIEAAAADVPAHPVPGARDGR